LWLLKCGLTAPQITKIGIFWYKFAQNEYIPLSKFYKIWHGGGILRPAPSCQISPLWLLKCGLTAPKIAKNGNCGHKFAPKGELWGCTKKLNIGAQLQTFLYAMTP